VVADNGVSGVHTRLAERPEGRRLFDKLGAGDTLVVRWVDRLGRNYEDVCDTIREFMRRGVIIRTVINGFTFDGATKDERDARCDRKGELTHRLPPKVVKKETSAALWL
jgi:putative DNA-invertase from lambdoid prophage Rac